VDSRTLTPRALIAVGGHALIPAHPQVTVADQRANARRTARHIVSLLQRGYEVVVTHGNGPQVGAALIRSEQAAGAAYMHPLDVCVAATQGEIGYLLQQTLGDELRAAALATPVATVVTQVVVAPDDPSLEHPTKPVGPFYTSAEADKHQAQDGWVMMEDVARGHRRVVPSPRPTEVVEEPTIRALVESGVLVIALGGGGIPVVREGDTTRGIQAVVDKDHSSALLAANLGASHYLNVTNVDRVYLDYPSHTREGLGRITASELTRHLEASHFPAGTMGPKVESVLAFLDHGGSHAVITSTEQLAHGLDPEVGTHVRPG
jgi:carbamate kinase